MPTTVTITKRGAERVRARRCTVRLPCTLDLDGRELLGFTVNLSTTGAHVRIPRGDVSIALGAVLPVVLRLPSDHARVAALGRVVWADANQRDVDGSAAFGLGLQFQEMSPPDLERLESLVQQFRWTVLLVDDDPLNLELLERTLGRDYRVIRSNGIPDHEPGKFPNRRNPNTISEQDYEFYVPLKPEVNEKPTRMRMTPKL